MNHERNDRLSHSHLIDLLSESQHRSSINWVSQLRCHVSAMRFVDRYRMIRCWIRLEYQRYFVGSSRKLSCSEDFEPFKARYPAACELFTLFIHSRPEKQKQLIHKTDFILSVVLVGVRYWKEHLLMEKKKNSQCVQQLEWNDQKQLFQVVCYSTSRVNEKRDWIHDPKLVVGDSELGQSETAYQFLRKLYGEALVPYHVNLRNIQPTVHLTDTIEYSTVDPLCALAYLGHDSSALVLDQIEFERKMRCLLREWLELCRQRLENSDTELRDMLTDLQLTGMETLSDSTLAMIAASLIHSNIHLLYHILGEKYVNQQPNSPTDSHSITDDVQQFVDQEIENTIDSVQKQNKNIRKSALESEVKSLSGSIPIIVKYTTATSLEEVMNSENYRTLDRIESEIKNLLLNHPTNSISFMKYYSDNHHYRIEMKEWLALCVPQTTDLSLVLQHTTIATKIHRLLQRASIIHCNMLKTNANQISDHPSFSLSSGTPIGQFDSFDFENREQLLTAIRSHVNELCLHNRRKQLEDKLTIITNKIDQCYFSESEQLYMSREKNRIFDEEYQKFSKQCQQREERNRRLRILYEANTADTGTKQRCKQAVEQFLRSQAVEREIPVVALFPILMQTAR